MKAMFIIAALALSFTASHAQSGGGTTPKNGKGNTPSGQAFGYFRIHRQASDVSLNWAVANPSSVTKFTIECSYDGNWFFEIDEVGCSSTEPIYKYRDTGAFPGYLSYRVVAHHADGSTENSEVETIRIVSRKG
ncbi:MAG: hypothetical protein GXC73_03210 [Chitinophagaceae bacterium]|nr:hypothetical protein [Chitinophagaceae bacterium]